MIPQQTSIMCNETVRDDPNRDTQLFSTERSVHESYNQSFMNHTIILQSHAQCEEYHEGEVNSQV